MANLITSCVDCNRGKAGKTIPQHFPTESDRLRASQENQEQLAMAKMALKARKAKDKLKQEIINYWCERTGRHEVDGATFAVIYSYIEEYGPSTVLGWIDKAVSRFPHGRDELIGRYISGIRRKEKALNP